MKLRDYQQEAVDWAYNSDKEQIVVQLATRLGKSLVISELTRLMQQDGIIVILTETSALIDQLDRHLQDILGFEPNIIKAGKDRYSDNSNVWLIMEQSFHKDNKYRKTIEALKAFDSIYVLRDEYSKASSGKRHKEIISFLDPVKTIGFDATPIDSLTRAVIQKENIKQFYSVEKAIDNGYWKKPVYIIPKASKELNLDEVKTTSMGDFDTSELSEKMQNIIFISSILKGIKDKFGTDKKWIIYCVDIAHAEMVTNLVKEILTDKVGVVHSKKSTAKNELTIEAFKSDGPIVNSLRDNLFDEEKDLEVNVLVSVMSLTIGFDAPIADGIINFRPTNILKLWHQFGSRANTPYKGKDTAYIIDAGLCSVRLGFLEEPLLMLEPDTSTREAKKALKSLNKESIINYTDSYDKELKFENIELLEQTYLKEKDNIYNKSFDKLLKLYDAETELERIIEIAYAIWFYLEKGYLLKQKHNSVDWILDGINEAIKEAEEDGFEVHIDRLTSSIKKRTKNIIKQGKKIASLRYFADWLLNESKMKFIYKTRAKDEDTDEYFDAEVPY